MRGFTASRGVDHDERVVGDDDVGLGTGAGGTFDEAFSVVRAAGIDALAAPVGERVGAGAAEQHGQPAGKVAADHVAIGRVGGPARHQLREDAGAALEAALQCILQVEQAGIILPPLARDDAAAALGGIGKQPLAFTPQLPLQRLGEGGNPDGATGLFRPERGGGKIAERLADAGARLRQHQPRRGGCRTRREGAGGGLGKGALAGAALGSGAGQAIKPVEHLRRGEVHGARLRAGRGLLPFGQTREQAALGLVGAGQRAGDERCPGPAQAGERLPDVPRALPLRPVGFQRGEQVAGGVAQKAGDGRLVLRRRQAERGGQAFGRRHGEARRVDEGEQLQQVKAGKLGIAQALRGERRVQEDDGRFRRGADRLAATDLARSGGLGDPGAAVTGVKGWVGQHARDIASGERIGNGVAVAPLPAVVRPCAGIYRATAGAGRDARVLQSLERGQVDGGRLARGATRSQSVDRAAICPPCPSGLACSCSSPPSR